MCQERILSWMCAKHINLGNTQEKGVVSETIKLFFFVFEKNWDGRAVGNETFCGDGQTVRKRS